ncbi:putative protein kinase RLK-Pelle-CrRLK1L-1 family [Helianthus annuus]|nr:putative protein kinase RLK-Pelle-CrRLK1L-1 family [Helianthus annuus]
MALIKNSEHLSIPFQDIEIATKNFNTTLIIGRGGFGNVYKGELLLFGKLTTVAVKRLNANNSGQGFKEFLTEIHLLSQYKHPNLVSLLGFCQEGNEKILVYEHAEHGSLDKLLTLDTTTCQLTCKQKIDICIDAACGLDYLHNKIAENKRVIHRDIKSANILLDHNWKAMISDLGLSKVGRANERETFLITNPCGTYGYCDPAYRDTGVLTKESDVYSFGVVLFEVLCGRLCFKNVDNEHRFLAPLARRKSEEGKVHEIIDPAMMEQLPSGSWNKISEIAYKCLHNAREKRPSMGWVVKELKQALEVQVLYCSTMDLKMEKIGVEMIVHEIFTRLPAKAIGGMYFDDSNDLKVLHIKRYRNVVNARVYSRRRESWRMINSLNITNFASLHYSWSHGIYSGKTIYFMVSNNWFPPGERHIVAFDVFSQSFSTLPFPEVMEVNHWQGHFLSIARKLHVIVVGRADGLFADLFKFEDETWIKVFSFNTPHIVDYLERRRRTNIIQDNKWLITSIWGDIVEVDLCNESFKYLQHVDDYSGPKGALFIETIVSPID